MIVVDNLKMISSDRKHESVKFEIDPREMQIGYAPGYSSDGEEYSSDAEEYSSRADG